MVRVLIVVGGLLLAANIWIIAGVSQRTNSEGTLPSAIEELIPKPGDLVSPEATIGINLRDDLTGLLKLDGTDIPLDEVVSQNTVGIITFSPGAGKQLTKFSQGTHRITVVYWPRRSSEAHGSLSYSWEFKVGA
jgi:hypothetical protein